MDKISVIIPIYNVAGYLDKCFESVINQTYKNIEILLIDDGSTDNSSSKCDSMSQKYSNVKTYHKKNGGLSDARNFGLSKCSGEYIYFLDSDDWIRKDTIEILYNLIIENKAEISECQYEKVNGENVKSIDEKTIISTYTGLQASYNLRKYQKNHVVSWNKLYKKSLFDKVKFPYGKCHEDEFTTYKVLLLCNKIVVTSQVLYYYRQTPNSIMNKEYNARRMDIFEAYEESMDFYKEKNLFELQYLTLYNYLDLIFQNYVLAKYSKNAMLCNKIKKTYFTVLKQNLKLLKCKHLPKFLYLGIKLKLGKSL